MQSPVQRIHEKDDAIVALQTLKADALIELNGKQWRLLEDIPAKHKFAARDFSEGDKVTMYGVTVGRTRHAIRAGGLLGTSNLIHATDPFTAESEARVWQAPDATAWQSRTFAGYRRSDGLAGTANLWLVVPLVFCENRNIAVMQSALNRALGYHKASPYEAFARELGEALAGAQRQADDRRESDAQLHLGLGLVDVLTTRTATAAAGEGQSAFGDMDARPEVDLHA
jgi:altronate hydrolase